MAGTWTAVISDRSSAKGGYVGPVQFSAAVSTLCTPRENEPQILHALGIFTTSGRSSSSIALVSPESSTTKAP